LRKELQKFEKVDKVKDKDGKERLYPIIESTNANLVDTRYTCDEVETKGAKKKANKLEE
jgi:hypothetical protein